MSSSREGTQERRVARLFISQHSYRTEKGHIAQPSLTASSRPIKQEALFWGSAPLAKGKKGQEKKRQESEGREKEGQGRERAGERERRKRKGWDN